MGGNCERCPETATLVDGIEAAHAAGLVYFSRLTPGAHIAPHCGPTNARLRCHLGLEVPPGARLRVGADHRAWQEGRCLVFEDSFEHEVWNDADRPRLVLILDVWHPDLSDAERWALTEVRRFSPGARSYWRRVRRSAR
ncbi:MAG: aspartyl/asparaginyl beta-hydroxylase domain-containing protein [Gemmatimonadota bacterium]